jgi:hypothetical protein
LLKNNGEEPQGRGFARGAFGQQNNTNLWWSPRLHMESTKSLPSLLLNGSNHILISSQSGPQSSIYSRDLSATPIFSGCFSQ